MSKTSKTLVLVSLFALLLAVFIPASGVLAASEDGRGGPGGRGASMQPGAGTGMGAGMGMGAAAQVACTACTTPNTVPLTDAEKSGLQDAILEEYGALNLYNAVIGQLGAQVPFSRIVRSEQQHVNALLRQAQAAGVEAPANPGLSNPPAFETLADACQAGVEAEAADAALYDELKVFTTNPALLKVYNNLQSASLNQHLPAFEACN